MGRRIDIMVAMPIVTLACSMILSHFLALANARNAAMQATASAMQYSTSTCKKRAATLCGPSSFTFYLHNMVYDRRVDNKDYFNSVYGRPPNVTWPNPLFFGTTSTFEDPLTSGPSNSSEQIGVGQGFSQFDSKVDLTLFHIFTANITKGLYKGTLNIFGQMHESDPVRYLTVVGGTGAFLGAHGLASCRLITIDRTPPAKWTISFDLDLYY